MDERLRALLRAVDEPVAPRPEFVEQLHDTLATRLGLQPPAGAQTRQQPATRAARPLLMLAATIALSVALVGGAVIGAAVIDRSILRPSALDMLRSKGTIRIAVRPDHPQVLVRDGALGGFDIDVAHAIGERLGLDTELAVMSVAEMMGPGTPAWDIAMPSTSLPADSLRRFEATAPYYYWPFFVLVPRSSSATQLADLNGISVCVVAASAGETWITQATDQSGVQPNLQPPIDPQVRRLDDDAACLADVQAGTSEALVTSSLAEGDLATRQDFRVLVDQAAGYELRSIILHGEGNDTASLMIALNEAISALQADGTLSSLSGRSFGGQDLSVPPAATEPSP